MKGPVFQILVVSSDPELPQALPDLLRGDAIGYFIAPNAEEAIRLVGERTHDLVTVDVESLGEAGFELLRRLAEDASLPLILPFALTGEGGLAGQLRAFDLGVTDSITRPFDAVARMRLLAHLSTKHRQDELKRRNLEL